MKPVTLMNKLAQARNQGEITEISYQFCEFLQRVEPEITSGVLLAACLASQRKDEGDVCVELSQEDNGLLFDEHLENGVPTPPVDEWIADLQKSRCVGLPGEGRPLILDENARLYLHKYWTYENDLAAELKERSTFKSAIEDITKVNEALKELFDPISQEIDWQKVAAWTSINQQFTVISGGPGTGKTTTVVKILLLMARLDILNHVALAAPTGKAASRLMESVNSALKHIEPDEIVSRQLPEQAFTIHKLLGARRHGSGFRYNRENPLPYDLVVVDEASMIDLALMTKLVSALPRQAKLILLGDKDQLASVEAGAVMGSICAPTENQFSPSFIKSARQAGISIPETYRQSKQGTGALTDHIVLLEKNYRFGKDSGIGNLAENVLKGQDEEVLKILRSDTFDDVAVKEYEKADELKGIIDELVYQDFKRLGRTTTLDEAMSNISRLGILCVHRRGPLGTNHFNRFSEQLLRKHKQIPATSEWYEGKPVMVTRNDYTLGLRNGELGITLKDEQGELKVYFQESGEAYRSFSPTRLSNIETAYALTVHKSQGSEFDDVVIILPQRVSAVSSRELLYTAITRARNSCTIVGKSSVLKETVKRKIDRSSGLKEKLWDDK